jgi:hypothetical protein
MLDSAGQSDRMAGVTASDVERFFHDSRGRKRDVGADRIYAAMMKRAQLDEIARELDRRAERDAWEREWG